MVQMMTTLSFTSRITSKFEFFPSDKRFLDKHFGGGAQFQIRAFTWNSYS